MSSPELVRTMQSLVQLLVGDHPMASAVAVRVVHLGQTVVCLSNLGQAGTRLHAERLVGLAGWPRRVVARECQGEDQKAEHHRFWIWTHRYCNQHVNEPGALRLAASVLNLPSQIDHQICNEDFFFFELLT